MPAPRFRRSEKLRLFTQLLWSHPVEAIERIVHLAEGRLDPLWRPKSRAARSGLVSGMTELSGESGVPLVSFLGDEPSSSLAQTLSSQAAKPIGPIDPLHNADLDFARACYAACRAIRPDIVVETGVAYGVTSAFVLLALQQNGKGELHSIDLPPLADGADQSVGALVPNELKVRWHLHRGSSLKVLPKLLHRLGQVGVFIHDSLHTHRTILRELSLVTPHLTRPAAVIADDFHHNRAFERWAAQHQLPWRAFAEPSKPAAFALALLA